MSTAFHSFRFRPPLWTLVLLLAGLLTGPGYEASSMRDVEASVCEPEAILLVADLDGTRLQDDGTAALHVRVLGTRAPVRMRLVNRTPGVVSLEGGSLQTAESSGGDDNQVKRTLYTHRAGDFDVTFELADEPCE